MTDDFERRIRDAVAAEGAGVQPDDTSLATIRHRVAMSKRRRLVGGTALGAAAALVIGIAIGVAAGGDDTTDVAVGGGSTTTTVPCPSTTVPATATTGPPSSSSRSTTSTIPETGLTSTPVTDTTIPPSAPEQIEDITHEAEEIAEENCGAPTTGTVPTTGTSTPSTEPSTTTTTLPAASGAVVFPVGLPLPPDQAPPVEWRTPEGIAQAYLDHIGATKTELSAYDDARQQIVVTRAGAPSGSVTARTVLKIVKAQPVCDAQGTCHEYWVVTEARSPAIVVDTAEIQPPADAQGHWTLALEGRARGFEGTVVVRVVGAGDVAWSAEGVITAGCCEQPEPFSTFVDLGQPPIGGATVLLANESGEDGSPWELTAFPIEIAIP